MSNQTDIDDLLGDLEGKKPAAKAEPKAAPVKAVAKPAAKKVVAKPAAKAAPAKKAAAKPAKPAAKAVKAPVKAKPAPAKKAAAKPVAKAPAKKVVAKPAAKPVAKVAVKPVTKAKPTVKAASNFIVFADGEREALCKRIKQMVRKPTNSRDLAEKLEIHSRKLRRVLYGMERAGTIKLQAGTSRKHGMFALPA